MTFSYQNDTAIPLSRRWIYIYIYIKESLDGEKSTRMKCDALGRPESSSFARLSKFHNLEGFINN